MKCGFCGHEVPPGSTECPYCHYQLEVDAKVLSKDERDSFDGITIEENGSSSSSGSRRDREEYQEEHRYGQSYEHPEDDPSYRQRQYRQGGASFGVPGIQIHTMGCGLGAFLITLILIGMLFLGIIALPYILVGVAIIYVIRFFFGGF